MGASPTCGTCGTEKVPQPSGRLVCRPCRASANRDYKKRNAARIATSRVDYRQRNRDALNQKQREYRAAHPELGAIYYAANAEREKARVKAYQETHRDRRNAYHSQLWHTDEAYRERSRARHRAWKKRNPDKVTAETVKRQLRQRQAQPAWASDELIAEAYALARLRTEMTGIPWQVDHIVPLNSDLVCGLHWEGNLQVIPAVANNAKNNDWWPDMPNAPARLVAFHEQPSAYLRQI